MGDSTTTSGGRVFVSYRRTDSLAAAGRIRDRLVSDLGGDNVYFDVESIPFGDDFRRWIREMITTCEAVVVVIGPHWLDAADRRGRRLDREDDWVRIEIESALERDIVTVPVCVDDATMPSADQLPESIRDLAFRNAAPVRNGRDFHADMDRVIVALRLGRRPATRIGRHRRGGGSQAPDDELRAIAEADHQMRLNPRAAEEGGAATATVPVLRHGTAGKWVTYLQNRLVEVGADLAPFGCDGHFGAVTESAVVDVQRRAGLHPDGIVGPGTWSALAVLGPGVAPTIGKGSSGPWVRHLQARLIEAGAVLEPFGIDGHFGAVTRSAVVDLQRRAALDPDGIVGPDTWAVLREAPRPPSP